MKFTLPARTLKQRFIEIILILFITTNSLFFILEQGMALFYRNFVISQSNDKLSLYTTNVERSLAEIQQYSIDIVGTYSIQNDLRTYLEQPNTYESYAAIQSLQNQFYATMVNRPSISDAFFIFPDNYKINIQMKNISKPREEFIQQVRIAAIDAQGSPIWQIDNETPSVIVFAKAIKSIYPSDKFGYCGVLILNLNTDSLLAYPVVENNDYSSMLACSVNGTLYHNGNVDSISPAVSNALSQINKTNITSIETKSLICKSVSSSISGWSFIHILDLDTLFHKTRQTRTFSFFIFAFIDIAVLILMLRLARLICQPLDSISKKMMSVQNGTFEQLPVDSKIRVQEIQSLTKTYNDMAAKINYLISEVYKKQLTISEIKYKMLQKQINPHFLYNTLETIHWKAIEDDDLQIAEMTISLSNLLRTSIKKPDIVTLKDELELVKDYITIQQIRFEERLVFTMDESSLFDNYHLPKMTIQPIVENSIGHNLEKYNNICRIHISFFKTDKFFYIIVTDNGTNADFEHINSCILGKAKEQSASFGLQSIQHRIQIYFGDLYGITSMQTNEIFTHKDFQVSGKIPIPISGTSLILKLPAESNIMNK